MNTEVEITKDSYYNILIQKMVLSYLVNLVVLAQKSCLPAISCISMLTGDEKEIFRTHRNHNQTQTMPNS